MKNLVIWYEKNEIDDPKEMFAELHINFWKIPHRKSSNKLLDIGINISNANIVSVIYIYIPGEQLTKENFDDLGGILISKQLLQAVFNEEYGILDHDTNPKYINILENKNAPPKFSVYKIDKESDLEIDYKYHGTIFKLKLCNPKVDTYFRFRLLGKFLDEFCNIEKPTNAIINSAFKNIEIFDFRVNEKRNMDSSLIERELNKDSNGTFIFQKFRFFFMCASNEEIISFSEGPFKRCRYLEQELWINYVNINGSKYLDATKRILAYQWNSGIYFMTSPVTVETPVARRPPHRSRRAELPHRAPQEYSLP